MHPFYFATIPTYSFTISRHKSLALSFYKFLSAMKFPQTFLFIEEMFQHTNCFHVSPDLLQQFHIFFGLGSPDLDAILQMRLHEGRTERDNHLSHPTCHPPFDSVHYSVVFWVISIHF